MNILITLIITLIVVIPAEGYADESLPLIDVETHALYYRLGGGAAVPAPGSGYVTHRVTARLKGGFNYSCGEFDFQNNISQMINQIENQVREIPMQLQNAVSAAVAGLPGYLMQKINPNLYNIVTKSLDETAELFRLSYKTCASMESEMRRHPGTNPYAGFMSVSIANKWRDGAESGNNIADVSDDIKQDPTGPVKWIGGKDYGSVESPIQVNHDLVIAGYNIMLGRSGDVSIDTKPTGNLKYEPIVLIWERPSAAGKWLQSVAGDREVVTEDRLKPVSITGDGLRPIVEDLEPLIAAALDTAITDYNFEDLNVFRSLAISQGIIDGLRAMPKAERLVFKTRLVSEMAVNEAYERVMLIRQMLMIGLNAPDIVAALAAATATEYVRNNTLPDLDNLVAEIYNDLALKKSTVNSTATAIVRQTSARHMQGVNSDPGAINAAPIMQDGATAEP